MSTGFQAGRSSGEEILKNHLNHMNSLLSLSKQWPRFQPWCKWRTKPWWGTRVQSGRTGWLPWWWLPWWQRRVWLQPRFIIWWRPKWFQHSELCHLGAENRRPGEGEDHVGGAEKVLPLNVVDLVPEQVRGEVQPIAALPVQSWVQSLLELLLRLLCCLFIGFIVFSAITESEETFSGVDKWQDN